MQIHYQKYAPGPGRAPPGGRKHTTTGSVTDRTVRAGTDLVLRGRPLRPLRWGWGGSGAARAKRVVRLRTAHRSGGAPAGLQHHDLGLLGKRIRGHLDLGLTDRLGGHLVEERL